MSPEHDHVSIEIMREFREGRLPDFEQSLVEDHLIDCDDCRLVFRRMEALLYDGFSVAAHAAAARREAIAADPLTVALRRVSEAGGSFAGAARRWIEASRKLWEPGALPVFGSLGAIPVHGSAEPQTIVLDPSTTLGTLRVAAALGDVQFEVRGGPQPLAILLFDPEDRISPELARFETAGPNHIARFSGVRRGEYGFAVSPEITPAEKP